MTPTNRSPRGVAHLLGPLAAAFLNGVLPATCGRRSASAGPRSPGRAPGRGSPAWLWSSEWSARRRPAVTLSARQRDHVQRRAEEEGVEQLVDGRLLHYRDIEPDTFGPGPFDAAATVEMGEHVGRDAYAPFVRQLHDLLRPGGSLLVQQMSRRGDHPGGGPFIERYVAPNMHMHMRPLSETTGLLEGEGEVRGVQAMREHHVRTARAWSDVLERRFDEMVGIAGPQSARVWRLYLAGGALAFEEGRMGADQILARRPGPRTGTGAGTGPGAGARG